MEKLKKLINTLKFKWLADALGTAIVVAVIVVLFLGINLFVKWLNPADIDATEESLYSLTDESKEIIGSLPDEDVFKIYMFDYDTDNGLIDFVSEYTRVNKNITVELFSSKDRPDLVSEYEVLENYGSVVIVKGDRHLTFNYYDFYNYDYDTGAYIDITEQRFTNGIISLSSIGKTTTVYELVGHNEISMSTDMTLLKTYLELENYEIKQLDLLTAINVPDDCETLVICSPEKDLAGVEADAIKAYIEKGGNIFWLCNPYSATGETPNFDDILLNMFAIKMRQDGVVFEQDSNKMLYGTPDVILPLVEYSEISENISNVLLFDSGKLEIENDKVSELSLQRTDLLNSSSTSFFRTNLELNPYSIAEGETAESNVVGCLMEKPVQDGLTTAKLIIIANNLFAQDYGIRLGDNYASAISFYKNMDFSLNCIGHLADVDDTMTIRKEIQTVPYTATETQNTIIMVIIFTVPVVIIIAGIVVWQIRRRKK